ncbi:MAG: type II secretion system protein GspG [Phycisphaerales bacterium]
MNQQMSQVEPRRWNIAGTVGFVLSALGLIGCCVPFFNLISIPGLILSFVGLFRPHRVLAVFGVILGLLGSILAVVISFVWLLLMLLGQTFGGLGQFAHVAAISGTLEDYRHRAGAYPAQLSQLPIDSEWRNDRWGHPFVYEPSADASSYRLRSVGPDGALNTSDDIDYSHMFTDHRRRWRVGPQGIRSVPQDECENAECEADATAEKSEKGPV